MPTNKAQTFSVFLCHASEDKQKVRELYQNLTEEGIDAWLEEEKLLPGQDWKLKIDEALRAADAILICISKRSVSKEGFVQKEIRNAIDIAEEKPEDTIFLIPVRFDECNVPRRLAGIQYVDLFDPQGFGKLIQALRVRAGTLGLSFSDQRPVREPDRDKNYELSSLMKDMLRDAEGLEGAIRHLAGREPGGNGWLTNEIRRELKKMMGDTSLSVGERARAGDVLSRVGDPRFLPDAWHLPDEELLGFIEIPAGPFQMGNSLAGDRAGTHPESPQHVVDLPTYFISRYPVTVAQFNSFLLDTKSSGPIRVGIPDAGNHPVVSVTWFEAMMYCQWLTDRLRSWTDTPVQIARIFHDNAWVVTLPSEAEWEKAARGGMDVREYPWGPKADVVRANYGDAGLKRTSAVGCFEAGKSPYGLLDMSGNVWEWTRSNWGASLERPHYYYPYVPHDQREDLQAPESMLRVIRGGSCHSSPQDIRCDHRGAEYPGARREHIGFRLAVTVPGNPGVKSINRI
jgi:formylglycine-generating enzyme required for sulfatase activity